MGMTQEHRDILINKRTYLVRNLIFSEIFAASMRENNIITQEFEEEIRNKTTSVGKNAEFLNILERRGPYAFDQFIKALEESDQKEIIKMIAPDPLPVYNPWAIKEQIDSDRGILIDEDYLRKGTSLFKNQDNQPAYAHDNRKGRAVVINIKNFKNPNETRRGSVKDLENLRRMFSLMQYDVICFGNTEENDMYISKEEIDSFLKDERDRMLSEGLKYFVWVIVIMSHGKDRCFYSSRNEEIFVDGVLAMFDGKNCRGLLSVPKVFLFQCCRGDLNSGGIGNTAKMDASSNLYKSDAVRNKTTKHDDKQNYPFVHEKADFFEAYCTVEGYASWRLVNLGSWFIRAVVYIFSRFCRHEDIQSMMTKVLQVVSYLETDNKFIQQPNIESTLNKKLYLL